MRFTLGRLNIKELESKVKAFWDKNSIPSKWREFKEGRPIFAFLEGPPTTNGYPHVGHIRGRTFKDVVLRYYKLKGYNVWAQGGWDEQGLPVEIEVEKKLKIRTKKDIEKFGYEKFIEECNKLINYYLSYWEDSGTKKLALWLDLDNAYETRRPYYIDHVWSLIKVAYQKGLLYEDFRVLPFCPRCETALSDAEVDLGYEEKVSPSIYVKFKVLNEEKTYLIIWTTTPWTLIDNEAVAVHPEGIYVKVRIEFNNNHEFWIVGKNSLQQLMEDSKISSYEVIKEFYGSHLEGLTYEHPLINEVPIHKKHKEHKVVTADFVSLSEGTGLVHIAPAHGPEDFDLGKKYGLPITNSVDINGVFNNLGGIFNGLSIENASKKVTEVLKLKGYLVKEGTIKHSYPHCWRCGTPLIYRTDKQWFLKITALKDSMINELKKVKIYPMKLRDRFDNWVANVKDWCISRNRFWGTPLPIWRCKRTGKLMVVGSLEELKKVAKEVPPVNDFYLAHRPWIDKVKIATEDCNEWVREPFVIDVWLDSGVAWIAGVNGLRNKDLFTKLYPYDFVTEGIDQTRGWFYSLLASSIVWFGKAPYKSILMQGWVLDKYGQKMSKSKGNVIWASDLLNNYGADPTRLYILYKSAPWDDIAFNPDEIKEINRALTILWNIFKFADTYMKLDKFNPHNYPLTKELLSKGSPEDAWLASIFNTRLKRIEEYMSKYELHHVAREFIKLIVEDLSHKYLRLIRRRVWREEGDDKYVAYATLYYVLKNLLTIGSILIPHITEYIYQSFIKKYEKNIPESIHLTSWPSVNEEFINEDLEESMDKLFEIFSITSSLRNSIGIKLRWPLRELIVEVKESKFVERLNAVHDLIRYICNVKNVSIVTKAPDKAKTSKYVSSSFSWGVLYLSRFMDKELYLESLAREIVRRVQVMRNKANLRVDDYIVLAYETADNEIKESINKLRNYIMTEVRAKEIRTDLTKDMFINEWEIDGKKVKLAIKRI